MTRSRRIAAIVIANLVVFSIFIGAVELFLRAFITFHPGYYTGVSGTSKEVVYPYGLIKINSQGFPDDEFELIHPRRIGYFGDSVTFGVGAGHGYRVSEYMEEAYPEIEHLNLGGIGLSISEGEIRYCKGLAEKFGLTDAIFLLNLNDVLPDVFASGETKSTLVNIREKIVDPFDWLRGRSYLYTYIRNKVKNLLVARGVGFHGFEAYELSPLKNEETFAQTAGRVNSFHSTLKEIGIELRILILPYEMQISSDAEKTYHSLGVKWESGFIEGSAQEVLTRHLDPNIEVIDGLDGFVNEADPQDSRDRIAVGQYFVYNKGDKLDWNHPNREGHRKLADLLINERVFEPARNGKQEQP